MFSMSSKAKAIDLLENMGFIGLLCLSWLYCSFVQWFFLPNSSETLVLFVCLVLPMSLAYELLENIGFICVCCFFLVSAFELLEHIGFIGLVNFPRVVLAFELVRNTVFCFVVCFQWFGPSSCSTTLVLFVLLVCPLVFGFRTPAPSPGVA